MPVIEVRNLKKYFGKVRAIDGVSFTVEEGEAFGFLGPNGAGKTTTIRCLMSFIKPTAGDIKIFTQDIKGNDKVRNGIGYLSGNIRLYDGWTGEDHIEYVKKLKGITQSPTDLIKKLIFNPKLKVKTLSTGNRQKLGLILALMAKPKLLILDEPTVGLDPLLQNTIYKILEEMKKSGTTIFVSSHNLPEVERLCDRVGIIKDGRLAALERIEDLESKRMHQVKIVFVEKINKSDFALSGTEIIDEFNNTLNINVKSDINPLLQKIAQYKIKDVEISHATLEEVFLEFYRK